MKSFKAIAILSLCCVLLMSGALWCSSQLNEITNTTVVLDGSEVGLSDDTELRIIHLSDLHL